MLEHFLKRFLGMTKAQNKPRRARPTVPSIVVSEITFSDGSIVPLGENDVTILVGPNNSGKSAALREIRNNFGKSSHGVVVHRCKLLFSGDDALFQPYLRECSHKVMQHGTIHYVGYDYEIPDFKIPNFDEGPSQSLKSFFTLTAPTDRRLSGSNPVNSIRYRKEHPSHPMHLLVVSRETERSVSDAFYKAFGKQLYVNRAGGSEVDLYIGDATFDAKPADDFAPEGLQFIESEAQSLMSQGDGMRAFATLALNTLAISQQSAIFLDEPEAFLHPPQARLTGRLVSQERERVRQIFIATHSSDVLKGVLENIDRDVNIIRISRSENSNTVRILNPSMIERLTKDPLIRFSGIFDGIFYQHLFICEADTDCQFYSAILESCQRSTEVRPDALFVQSAGKHRMAKLGSVAKQLGVPFSIIVDFDALNEQRLFKDLCEACDVEWERVSGHWAAVKGAIESRKAPLTAGQLISAIEDAVNDLRQAKITTTQFIDQVRDRVRANSPWEVVKVGGRSALPLGEAVEHFDALVEICAGGGLWIVPQGELEGFCRTVKSRKGSSWMIELSERFDLATAPELSDARKFVQQIWNRAVQLN
jgi:hypothetical protein